jgi:SAM-dependent methyltransferase
MTHTVSVDEGYVIDPAWGREHERLALLAEVFDPWTRGQLDKLGVAAGWHCLDVGAGNGSIAAWLADRVGPQGRSVATDIDTRFLDGVNDRVEVLRHDVLTDDFPEACFDLIHTRALIMHLAEPERVIGRMVRWLRPDGRLLLEEAEGLIPSFALDPVWVRLVGALSRFRGFDVHCGHKLPGWLVAAGLVDVAAEAFVQTVRGGSRYATWFQLGIDALNGPLQASGLWSRADIDAVAERLRDPGFIDFGMILLSCSASRAE